MKPKIIVPPKPEKTEYLTSAAMVREDWIASGISESLVDANKSAIIADAKNNLNAWIAEFVSSFKAGRLRKTLENSYFVRETGFLRTTSGDIKGLAVIVRPGTLKEFHFLLSKIKTLRYRILTRDSDVTFLIICTPNLQYMTATSISTGESVELVGNGEVGL
jgi:hypothetical protein